MPRFLLSLCALLLSAACTSPPASPQISDSSRGASHDRAPDSHRVRIAIRDGRLFGITSDGYTVFDDAGQLRAVHVLGNEHAVGMCIARSCNVEIRGRWVFIQDERGVTAWTAEHGAHALGGEAMGFQPLGTNIAVNAAGDRVAFCRLSSASTRCFGANAPTLETHALDLAPHLHDTVTLLGNDRIVALGDDRARLFDRDWNGVPVTLPARFETIASYPESIIDPDGKNVFGRVDGRFAAIPLETGSARASFFGEVPSSEEAIRGKAGWRTLLAFKRGAIALEKRTITFWNAGDRTTMKLGDVDQRQVIAGLVAVAPDETHVLYVADGGTKIVPLDGAHRPAAIPGTPLRHREAFTADSAHVVTLDAVSRTARAFALASGHDVLLGENVHDLRPLSGGSRVIVCDHRDARGTCDLAIVDAATGARTNIAAAVRTGEDDMGLGRSFAVRGGHVAYLASEPTAVVVAPLPSQAPR